MNRRRKHTYFIIYSLIELNGLILRQRKKEPGRERERTGRTKEKEM